MTLPVSGEITLEDIQAEFGGPTPIELFNYYRGGAYVSNTAANASIPTSGEISLFDFYGAEALSPLDFSVGVHATSFSSLAQATFRMLSTGASQREAFDTPGSSSGPPWLSEVMAGNGDDFDVMASLNSGSASGTFGSWVNMSSNRAWTCTRPSGNGTTSASISVSIRAAGGGPTLANGTISLSASIEP